MCSYLAQKAKEADPELNRGGRPNKSEIVKRYLNDHPGEKNISKIARECGVARDTVYKYLN